MQLSQACRFAQHVARQQKAMLLQFLRCASNDVEWQICTLGNVEQRMPPVRKIEYPQCSLICGGSLPVTTDRAIKSILSKLWFAFWHSIAVDHVVFYHIERLDDQLKRLSQMLWPHEIEIVCRGVILGKLAERAALERSYW